MVKVNFRHKIAFLQGRLVVEAPLMAARRFCLKGLKEKVDDIGMTSLAKSLLQMSRRNRRIIAWTSVATPRFLGFCRREKG